MYNLFQTCTPADGLNRNLQQQINFYCSLLKCHNDSCAAVDKD